MTLYSSLISNPANFPGSTLPPDNTTPIFLPCTFGILPASNAATGAAPLGSTSSFRRSSRKRVAAASFFVRHQHDRFQMLLHDRKRQLRPARWAAAHP